MQSFLYPERVMGKGYEDFEEILLRGSTIKNFILKCKKIF